MCCASLPSQKAKHSTPLRCRSMEMRYYQISILGEIFVLQYVSMKYTLQCIYDQTLTALWARVFFFKHPVLSLEINIRRINTNIWFYILLYLNSIFYRDKAFHHLRYRRQFFLKALYIHSTTTTNTKKKQCLKICDFS